MPDQEFLNAIGQGYWPGFVGIVFASVEPGETHAELQLQERHMAPNGYIHAGAVVSLADTCAGYGCVATLPDGAVGFTTVELKTNFLSSARDGTLDCAAKAVHRGRRTQIWDAAVTHRETGKTLALFRCTQMILYEDGGAVNRMPESSAPAKEE